MRFTPTAKYLAYARGLAKNYRWKLFVKKTTDLSEALTTGTWIDVTDFTDIENLNDIVSRLERETAQFTHDNIAITGSGIEWWKANIFNTTQYIEVKLLFELGLGRDVCSDLVYTFNGIVDRRTKDGTPLVTYTESIDKVEFTARTLEDHGMTLAGENLAMQYVDPGTGGLILPSVPGVFVTKANIADYILQPGTHRIGYRYNLITHPEGTNEIVNGDFGSDSIWSKGAGWTISGGKAHCDGSQVSESQLWQVQLYEPDIPYRLTFTFTHTGGFIVPVVGGVQGILRNTSGTFSQIIYPGTSPQFYFLASDDLTCDLEDVSLVKAFTITNSYEVKLDDGPWTELSGVTTCGNGTDPTRDTQRVEISYDSLPQPSDELEETVVVIQSGDLIPYLWPRNVSVRMLLDKVFDKIGITSRVYDLLEAPTWDGNPKVSFVDAPPGDEHAFDKGKIVIISDGVDLWIPIGNKIYRRVSSTGAYELKGEISAGFTVIRLWYNAAHGHLWGLARVSDNIFDEGAEARIFRLTVSNGTVAEVTPVWCSRQDMDLIDTSGKYAFLYVADASTNLATGSIMEIDGATMVETDLGKFGGGSGSGPLGMFGYVHSGNKFAFIYTTGSLPLRLHQISWNDTTDTWDDDGEINSALPFNGYEVAAAYHPGEDRIYFANYAAGYVVKSHAPTGATLTTIYTPIAGELGITSFHYLNGKIYFTTGGLGRLFSIENNVATLLHDGGSALPFPSTESLPNIVTRWYGFAFIDRLYGMDATGKLYQFHTAIALYTALADFSTMKVTEALKEILTSFQLIGNVSSTKVADVYRRGDENGDPVTSGNVLSLTVDDPDDIVEENSEYGGAYDLIIVSNNRVTYSFNGTAFNTAVLTDARSLTLTKPLIPDEIVKDICYFAFQFFKTGRTRYTISLGNMPMFQIEPFDGATVVFDTTKIKATAINKPIYATILSRNATMAIEVLI